jgi:hypothetical protein
MIYRNKIASLRSESGVLRTSICKGLAALVGLWSVQAHESFVRGLATARSHGSGSTLYRGAGYPPIGVAGLRV